MNERWDEALRSLRDEPLDERMAGEVRAAVLGRIRRERRQRWVWVAAAAAVVLVAAGLSVQWRAAEVPALPQRAGVEKETVLSAKPAAAAVAAAVKPRRVETRRRLKPAPLAPTPLLAKEAMKIHIVTDDPDLVIIWLVGDEEEGGGE